MALGITNRGASSHGTSVTSFTLSPSGNFAASSMAALAVGADNSVSGGATNNITSVTDSIGNTWTKRSGAIYDPAAASAGSQMSWFTTDQNVGPLQTGTVITVNFADATVAKAWTLTEITASAGTPTFSTSGVDNDNTLGLTTASVTSGDVVLAGYAGEAGTTQTKTDDTTTTNGTWTTGQFATVGATTSGHVLLTQGKVTTGTGTQTYQPSFGLSMDKAGSWIVVTEVAPPTGTAASSFGWSTSETGTVANPVTGTAASAFPFTADGAAGTVINPVTGTSDAAFGWSTSAAGAEALSGAAGSQFGWSTAGSAVEAIAGAGASQWGWGTAAAGDVGAVGPPPVDGTAASAFGWGADGAAGTVLSPITGTGASAFGASVAGVGAETMAGVAASAFGFASAGSGINAQPVTGAAASVFGWGSAGAGNALDPTTGVAASAFGWSTTSAGNTVPPYIATPPPWNTTTRQPTRSGAVSKV